MKKLTFFTALLLLSSSLMAQLEYVPEGPSMNFNYETILKQLEEKIPSYQSPSRTADPAWFEEYMIDFQEELYYPGVSACFLRDGEVYWKSHQGFANINAAIPVDDETAYTVASISKTIMITAVMQLYEEQLFELDDDISDHIPFLVRNFHHPDIPITIKQLVTHTSSIQDNYVVLNDVLHIGGDNPIPMDEFLEGYLLEDGSYYQNDNYYGYAPGTTFNYSNVGSCIVAYLVEVKTGLDFETYCQQYVFGPLGMEQTSYLFESLDPAHLAIPYTITGINVVSTPQTSWPIYPIGNLKVSALQLAKHLAMNMNGGSFHDSLLLEPETVELITDHHYINNNIPVYLGLIWFIDPYPWFYSHTGRWYGFNTIYGYNKENNSGMIWLSNGDNYNLLIETIAFWFDLTLYSNQYQPFSLESLTIDDSDGDGIFEAGETLDIYPGIRNNTNMEGLAADLSITMTSNSPYISSFNDPDASLGDISYLEEIQNLSDPISLQLTDQVAPGNCELLITVHWGEDNQFEFTHEIYLGQADLLVVTDEEDNRGKIIPAVNWYRQVLDSIGYSYQVYDPGQRGDPTSTFLANFPVVIWFTGYDTTTTLTQANQQALATYLDNGGNLFLSGQNISEELSGGDFLTDYLAVEHVEDTWAGSKLVFGVDGDPIGDGLAFAVGQGDGLNNQLSMSVLEPLNNAYKVFTYLNGPDGAAVRYENNTYKTVFFGFGFEAINNFDNRYAVMYRILNDYFGVVVRNPDPGLSTTAGNSLKIYPIPATGQVTLAYSLQHASTARIDLYSLTGNHILTLRDGMQNKGVHHLRQDLSGLQAGVYLCVLKTAYNTQTVRIILY